MTRKKGKELGTGALPSGELAEKNGWVRSGGGQASAMSRRSLVSRLMIVDTELAWGCRAHLAGSELARCCPQGRVGAEARRRTVALAWAEGEEAGGGGLGRSVARCATFR